MMTRRVVFALVLGTFLIPVLLATAQDDSEVPNKPRDLKATRRYDGATAIAVLEWREDSDNELGFEVLRSDNNQDYRVVGMVGANTTRYEDRIGKYITGAFTYKVQAGKSEDSNVVSAWF